MAITLPIKRNFNIDNIVAITTTNDFAEITAPGYFETQEPIVERLNNGPFEFSSIDIIRISYADGQGWFTYNASTDAFELESASNALPAGQILVGNADGIASPVEVTGDVLINASGATTIAPGTINSSKLNENLLQYVRVPISSSNFTDMHITPKLLVPAGGANTMVVLDKMFLAMQYGGVAYTAGGVTAIQWDSTASGLGVIASTTLTAATFFATASTGFIFNGGVVPATYSTCVDKGLYLSNITTSFNTGTSNMLAHVWYKIIPSNFS